MSPTIVYCDTSIEMTEISKTADLALRLLEEVGERGPVTATELVWATGLNRSVVHRLLATLRGRGFIRRAGDAYVLGAAAFRLTESNGSDLILKAQVGMQDLSDAVGETVTLQGIDGSDVVLLAQAVSRRHAVRVEQNVIDRHPLHLGATGRVLLAYSQTRVIDRALAKVEDAARIRRQLDDIRAVGYTASHEELQPGVHCVAAPVLSSGGRILAALGVLVPVNRAAGMDLIVEPLLETVAQIRGSAQHDARVSDELAMAGAPAAEVELR